MLHGAQDDFMLISRHKAVLAAAQGRYDLDMIRAGKRGFVNGATVFGIIGLFLGLIIGASMVIYVITGS